ncbi:hypothetical protein [Shigella phage ESh20]|nr:hypothetical protein [Shigella phage ESh20]
MSKIYEIYNFYKIWDSLRSSWVTMICDKISIPF